MPRKRGGYVRYTLARMIAILLMGMCLRIGEASNPGPSQTESRITIGCFNPTGLLHKADTLDSLPHQGVSIWGVSETHLSKQGIAKFKQELLFRKSRFKFWPGAPAPLRSTAATALGGKQVGAGFISDVPSRCLHQSWSPESWNEARFTLNTFFVQGHWVHAAVVYGYAYRAESVEVRAMTDELMQQVTNRIGYAMKGKRIIMGDFNQLEGQLSTIESLKSMGWKEVQMLAFERYNREISKTCKSTTTKDFIWISPELVPFFEEVETKSMYSDHLTLCAHFKSFGPPSKVYLWRKPKAFNWKQHDIHLPDEQYRTNLEDTSDTVMKNIAEVFENRIHKELVRSQKGTLPHQQRGRSRTTDVVELVEHNCPIKSSRSGERNPTFDGHSLQHKQWFTQIRRLQCLIRTEKANTLKQQIHRHREWRAVLKAAGFPCGFPQWWRKHPTKIYPAPSCLPEHLPPYDQLTAIFLTFELEFNQLEQLLKSEMIKKAKANRLLNPHKIFADVRKPPVSPVNLLDNTIKAIIVAVDPDSRTVTIDRPTTFDPSQPVTIGTENYQIQSQQQTQMKLTEITEQVVPGVSFRQEKFVGELQELFSVFGKEWSRRWDRHRNLPQDHWNPILDCFKQYFPSHPEQQFPEITLELWRNTLRKKKTRAATGPDAWSREDLLRLPDDLTNEIIRLLSAIEQGKSWPTTVITGLVCSLEKVVGASTVNQYRPITVFSIIYRTWSSIRAKQCLRHMLQFVPATCFGNIPQRSTTQVWLGIQSLIEQSAHDQTQLSGVMVDIIKCFNHLPRIPIIEVCCHLGIPAGTLRAWGLALCQMQRRFVIRGSVGPALTSTTGCAEGCGLSVVGMLAINILVDFWVTVKLPQITLWSYVDNLEVTTPKAEDSIAALQTLSDILQALDLDLDKEKTFVWANSSGDRKVLRDNQLNVKMWARDLGGHVQYSRQNTNAIITSRISAFKERWKDFARSHAPYHQKLAAIKMVAWQNVLHGITSVHLSDEYHDELRTGALRGLQAQSAGTSPIAHLSLVEHPSADPGFYALWKTTSDIRTYLRPESCIRVLDEISRPTTRLRPDPGPTHVLLGRMHQIGWHWSEGCFLDCNGDPVDIWSCPIQELYLRIVEGWQNRVLHVVSQRKSFEGLWKCSPAMTHQSWPEQPGDRSLLRTCLNGTFYTADHLRFRPEYEAKQCPFCGQEDSRRHRHWECKQLAEARSTCPPETIKTILSLPPATYNHGWIPRPASLSQFRSLLQKLPDAYDEVCAPNCLPDEIHIFTDGSCKSPQERFARLGAWGVTVGTFDTDTEFFPVARGLVSGIIQTITRAEYIAVIAALAFVSKYPRPFTIWIDNQTVWKAVRKLAAGYVFEEVALANKKPSHDLLQRLADRLRPIIHLCVGIQKVNSHQDLSKVTDPAERWILRGNDSADQLASSAFDCHPHIVKTQSKLLAEISELNHLRGILHRTLIAVGNVALDKLRAQRKGTHQPDIGGANTVSTPAMVSWKWPDEPLPEYPKFRVTGWRHLVSWSNSLHDLSQPVQIWSWPQLMVDFLITTGETCPWYDRSIKRWSMESNRQNLQFSKRSRNFQTYVTKIFSQHNLELPVKHSRPDSFVLQFWCMCLPVRASKERNAKIDEWFMIQKSHFRHSSDLQSLTIDR